MVYTRAKIQGIADAIPETAPDQIYKLKKGNQRKIIIIIRLIYFKAN